jgi:hypothetical protein
MRRADVDDGVAAGCGLELARREERPGHRDPGWLEAHGDRHRWARPVEEAPHGEIDGVEALGRRPGEPARGADPQDPSDVEEAQRAALGRPGRDDPARRLEREGEDVHLSLRRRSLGVAEADARRPPREQRPREGEEGAQLAVAVHEGIVGRVRTRGVGSRGAVSLRCETLHARGHAGSTPAWERRPHAPRGQVVRAML